MSATDQKNISVQLRDKAQNLGFDLFGIAQSGTLSEEGRVLSEWCNEGMNADMSYLGRDIEKRINPELILPGAKSVIVTGLNYYTERKQGGNGVPVISRYAYGTDYHYVIKKKLEMLIDFLIEAFPDSKSRSFVDSAPVVEKAWAVRAGLGWRGRHSIIINKKYGSFFFLGVIITDLELEYNKKSEEDHCGSCRKCIEACPAKAINENRTIDARRCISYITIESDIPVTPDEADHFDGKIFGCDVCQEVCPWNKNVQPHNTPEFVIPEILRQMSAAEWKNLTRLRFKTLFKRSPIGRTKFETFIQNVTNVTK